MTKQIITLSDNAAARIKEIMSKDQQNSLGVRVGVKSGGCAGMSYIMEYTKEINPNDELIEDKGVKVFIDSAAVIYLLGTEMDYKKDQFSSHLCSIIPMKQSVVDAESHSKSSISLVHTRVVKNTYLLYKQDMNKFEFKNLVKDLKDNLKERSFFKVLRKEVETGANGTQDYVVKKGVNKDSIASTKQ